jgi:hypothetical protein
MWTISSHTSLLWRTDADNAGDKLVTPMTLLPGRFRLATSPFYRVGCYPKDDRDTTARWSLASDAQYVKEPPVHRYAAQSDTHAPLRSAPSALRCSDEPRGNWPSPATIGKVGK